MKNTPDTIAVIVLLTGLALVCARITVGCMPAAGPEAAGAGYATQQLACVDEYHDRHNIDACRAKVRAAWGIDAGQEGGW